MSLTGERSTRVWIAEVGFRDLPALPGLHSLALYAAIAAKTIDY